MFLTDALELNRDCFGNALVLRYSFSSYELTVFGDKQMPVLIIPTNISLMHKLRVIFSRLGAIVSDLQMYCFPGILTSTILLEHFF